MITLVCSSLFQLINEERFFFLFIVVVLSISLSFKTLSKLLSISGLSSAVLFVCWRNKNQTFAIGI